VTGEARIHHWVPQTYLKNFAKSPSKNAQIYVVDKTLKTSFITSPRNIASARDFNRVDVPGVNPNQVESDYSKFEGELTPALRRMMESRTFGNAEDHNLILNLIALLAIRTPRMRENIRTFHEQVAKMVMNMTLESEERFSSAYKRAKTDGFVRGPSVSYESMKKFVESDQYSISVSTTSHVERELNLMNQILPLLGQRTWTLLHARPGTGGFVTSDHPVSLQWTEQKDRGVFSSPGFALRGTEVLFPVSHDVIELGQHQVAHANTALIFHATRQVYARDDKFFYLRGGEQLRRGSELSKDIAHL
jgi:hypothetical protein